MMALPRRVHITYVSLDPSQPVWHVISDVDPSSAQCGERADDGWLSHASIYATDDASAIVEGAQICVECKRVMEA